MFKRLFKRLSQDATELRAGSIRAWCDSLSGVTHIEDAQPRSVARIAGVVEGLRLRPREDAPAIEAVLTDGTGKITVIWLGRRSIPGVRLGSRLIVQGMIGSARDHLHVINPTYEFAPTEHD